MQFFVPDCNADIGFVIDASSTVGTDNWARVILFLQNFVSNLVIGPAQSQVMEIHNKMLTNLRSSVLIFADIADDRAAVPGFVL